MTKSAKSSKKKHSKSAAPSKKQEKPTEKKRMTALGRHMERAKVEK